MVRHEAAEALGAIATPEAMDLLGQFLTDKEPAVKESCVVGTSCTIPSFPLPNDERPNNLCFVFVLLVAHTPPLWLTRPNAALDMSEYVNSDSFEYADTLQLAKAQLAAAQ